MSEPDLYEGREQTLVKHLILGKYLERFAIIIGFRWKSITYVDCFSGPWNVRSDELKDSSFSIALEELRKARETHRLRGKDLKLRCFFLEKDPTAYAMLKDFADQVHDAEVDKENADLESSVGAITSFIRQGGSDTFPFIFIDPTGWTGFAMDIIAPLLRLEPGEVLINFMTGHVKRFIDSPQKQTEASFAKLFGSTKFKSHIVGMAKQDREDAVVNEYCQCVRRTGKFKYVSPAIVLHPEFDRTHFHLIYATRHESGLEAFKKAEKNAMTEMGHARAGAQRRRREQASGMSDLFPSDVLHDPSYYESLRTRYLSKAQNEVFRQVRAKGRLPYDTAWEITLANPLTWESDLKDWIRAWVKQGTLKIEGLSSGQRVPHLHEGNVLALIKN